jgi:hypothetical protein
VPGRAHEVVEGLGEVGMGGQVLPERPAEQPGVARLAGPDIPEQRAPGGREAPPDAVQVEERRRLEQFPRRAVESEPARRRLLEHPLAHQVA